MIPEDVAKADRIPGWYPPSQLKQLSDLIYWWCPEDAVALEVGTWLGRSAAVIAPQVSVLYCVDTWSGIPEKPDDDRYYHGHVLEQTKKNLADLNIRNVQFVTGDSKEVLNQWPNEHFDFIHIDGDHGEPTVHLDMFNGWRLLKRGGVICGDDYREQPVRDAVAAWIRTEQLTVVDGRFWWGAKFS